MKRERAKAKSPGKDIILGAVIFIVIEAIFMIGGLLFERASGNLITGVPSAIGLSIIILIGILFLSKKREYVFIGMSLLAFLPPSILFVFRIFAPSQILLPILNYSLVYVALLVIVIYLYLFFKLLKENN